MENKNKQIFQKLWPVVIGLTVIGLSLLFYLLKIILGNNFLVSPLSTTQKTISQVLEKPMEKYSILSLGNRKNKPSEIVKEEVLKENPAYISYLVSFKSDGKKVTGMMNVPVGDPPVDGFPVIVMFRGYVDPTMYETGIGTQRAGEVFAQNGFITFAPDFLGYGGSDKQSENVMEERFQTYTVALDALASVINIEKANPEKVGIWAHSNGGQIAITILEATGKDYPTTLWAPVTKPFPYSVLYYTDEADDRGKFLRREIAKFEEDYDIDKFSITDYFKQIKASIQLHQGEADEAVPQKWSDEFYKFLDKLNVDITYYTYPGADHNLMLSWDTVVSRNLQFFNSQFSAQ